MEQIYYQIQYCNVYLAIVTLIIVIYLNELLSQVYAVHLSQMRRNKTLQPLPYS